MKNWKINHKNWDNNYQNKKIKQNKCKNLYKYIKMKINNFKIK